MNISATCRTVSIPRSGNVLLLRHLHAYYGLAASDDAYRRPDLDDIVKGIPVLAGRSHDFRLIDPLSIPGTLTLIQYREPLAHFLSYVDRSETLKPGALTGLSPSALWRWAAKHALYVVGFLRKWTKPVPSGAIVIPYEELAADSTTAIERLLRVIGETPDRNRLLRAKSLVSGETIINRAFVPFVRRDLAKSQHLPPEVAATFRAYVHRHVAWLGWPELDGPMPRTMLSDFEAVAKRLQTAA